MSSPQPERTPSAITIAEFRDYQSTLEMDQPLVVLEELAQDWAVARIPIANVATRPGGYVPGPTMMGAVDYLGWILVFTRLGITPMALTWDLSISFLRPAIGGDVVVRARQTKFGTFSHSTYELSIDGDPDRLVAHGTTTYAVPRD